jgi:hypothetical protein
MLDGKPVDGADVNAQGAPAFARDTSGGDGSFELSGLAPGEYEVYAQSNRVGAFTHGPKVKLAAGEHKTGVEVDLDLAGSISGVVVDQNDQPVAGAFLSFTLLKGRDVGSATTADDGSFTVGALSGGGEYAYEVRPYDRSVLVLPPAVGKRHPPIAVADGKTHVTGVRIAIKYERLAINGRVIDAAGKPVPDARINATPEDLKGWWGQPSTIMSDQTGAFAVGELPAGDYSIEARTPRGTAHAEHVAAGGSVVLQVPAAGGIDGTLDGFADTPEVDVFSLDDYRHRAAAVTGTTFQLRDLPPGHYRVTARSGADTDAILVEVAPEAIAKAILALRPKGIIAGRVIDAKTHAPLSDLTCYAALARREDTMQPGSSQRGRTDLTGAFTIEGAPAGDNQIACWGESVSAWGNATVIARQTVTVELTAQREGGGRQRNLGMELANQLSDVVVTTVTPSGPAATAGIAVGDIVVSVDGHKVGRYEADLIQKQLEYEGSLTPTIVLERGDTEVTVTLKLAPPSSPAP